MDNFEEREPAFFEEDDYLAKPSDRAEILREALTKNPSNAKLLESPLLIDSAEVAQLEEESHISEKEAGALRTHPRDVPDDLREHIRGERTYALYLSPKQVKEALIVGGYSTALRVVVSGDDPSKSLGISIATGLVAFVIHWGVKKAVGESVG